MKFHESSSNLRVLLHSLFGSWSEEHVNVKESTNRPVDDTRRRNHFKLCIVTF